MKENRHKLIMSILGIAILTLSVAGATFAYFSTQMTGTDAVVSASTKKYGEISFTASNVTFSSNDILPGWESAAQTVTITRQPSEVATDYRCTIQATNNTFSNLYVKTTGAKGTGANTEKDLLTSEVTLTESTIAANSNSSVTETFTYVIGLRETGTNQNTTDSGKSLTARVTCVNTSNQIFYSASANFEKPTYYKDEELTLGMAAPASPANAPSAWRKVYMGYDVDDEDDTVSVVYGCFKLNNNEYCIKAYDTSAYTNNTNILTSAFGSSNCTTTANSITCRGGSFVCDSEEVIHPLRVTAWIDGKINLTHDFTDGFNSEECYFENGQESISYNENNEYEWCEYEYCYTGD